MRKTTLFRKFIVWLIPLVVLTAASTAISFGLVSKQAYMRLLDADYRVAAQQAGRRIEFFLSEALRETQALAELVSTARLDQWRTHLAMTQARRQLPRFQQLALIDPDGREIANSLFSQDLYRREAWQVYQDALTGRLAYSRAVIQDQIPVMFMAAPVYYDGRLVAVIWVRLNLKPVWDVVIQLKRDLNFGPQGHVYLVDQQETLLASDEVSRQFGQRFAIEPPPGSDAVPPMDLTAWRERKGFNTYDPETLKSLLQDRPSRPALWLEPINEVENIIVRAKIEGVSWVLYMVQPYDEAFYFLSQGMWTSIGLVLVAVVVGLILLWLMTRRLLQPINQLHLGVTRAAQGDFTKAIAVTSRDEVGQLALHFNYMQTALKEYIQRLGTATADLNHAKCLAVLGTTVSKVNHQMANFLNNLVVALSILKSDRLSDSSQASLVIIEENTRQIQKFIERLLNFSRRADLDPVWWRPDLELAGLVESFRGPAQGAKIELTLVTEDMPLVLADAGLLRQALANLMQNALEAVPPGGQVVVTAGTHGDRVKIEVADNGPGISPQDLEQVFTPFFTTKKGKGTGLGLALAQNVIQAHGGEIVITSKIGQGTKATCWLPVAPYNGYGENRPLLSDAVAGEIAATSPIRE